MEAARMRTDTDPGDGHHAKATTRFRSPRTLALMNQKGGVGKTTSAVNLATGLAQLGHATMLIDLDPQAHATLHLGLDPSSSLDSVYDVLLKPESIAPIEVRPNLSLLPAITDLAAAETELSHEPDRQDRLSQALNRCGDQFDFVLIDCPPSLGLLTLNALAAVREVIVPMQAHFLALQGVGKLLETVRLVGAAVNPQLRVAGIVLCMHEENTRHAREVVADIEGFFEAARTHDVPWNKARVYKPPIRRNIKLAEAPSFGQTIFEYEQGCPGARDYRALAGAIASERPAPADAASTKLEAPRVEVKSINPAPAEASA